MSLRTFRYTWSCRSRCRHHYMSPYNVVSSYLAVSPLPPKRRSVFCYGIHKITPICAFHSEMLYPVRTFLNLGFLMVISSSLLVLHILTTERLLRYSSLTFLELPHQKSQIATEAFYLYVNELFVAEFALELVVLSVNLLHGSDKSWSDVFTMFVALH